jgi:hypothetical protein
LLTPRRVETRARLDDLHRIEGRLDIDDLATELVLHQPTFAPAR